MNPSPRTHIYRMGVLLVLGIIGFAVIRTLAVPASWDSENWYRLDAEEELKELPMRYGGNESCTNSACHEGHQSKTHEPRQVALADGQHSGLACEVCHGPLTNHVKDGETVGHALINGNNDLCLSCHENLVTRPEQIAQFKETLLYHALLGVNELSACRSCHNPHDPNHPN